MLQCPVTDSYEGGFVEQFGDMFNEYGGGMGEREGTFCSVEMLTLFLFEQQLPSISIESDANANIERKDKHYR